MKRDTKIAIAAFGLCALTPHAQGGQKYPSMAPSTATRSSSFSAEGYCNHWDRDGHLWVGRWWSNSKMDVGRYEVFAGEGKYAGTERPSQR